jgi:hypothetical protein
MYENGLFQRTLNCFKMAFFQDSWYGPYTKTSCDIFQNLSRLTPEKTKDPYYPHTTHTPAALLRAYGSIMYCNNNTY